MPLPDRLAMWVANHLPRLVLRWAVIVAGVRAAGATRHPGDLVVMDLLKFLEKRTK